MSSRECEFNTRRMLLFSGVYGAACAIAMMGIFDAYIFIESNDSNTAVGWAESVSGLSQILVALPAGFLVDSFSRCNILNICGLFSLIYCGFFIFAISQDSTDLIYSALIFGGILFAVQNTATYSLYADSVPQGFRAKAMMEVAVVTQVSMAIGPILGALLFWVLGDSWDLKILHAVLYSGFALMIPGSLLLIGWKDVHADPAVEASGGFEAQFIKRHSWSRLVPYMVCLNDVITCIGAGMTVKFLPLFFKNEYGFTPAQVQSLYAVYLVTFGFFTWLCERIASYIGRVQAALLFSSIGVTCLFILARVTFLPLVVIVFVLRGALQNAIYPIDRSIIMDFVPSDQRGKWNAFESISSMTWSGSAVIGGYLMDEHDYRYAFQITAYIYSAAFCMRIPMMWLVPRKEQFVGKAFTESLIP